MKKRFVSLCLAGLIMVAPASAVFTDISDSRVSQTAAVLDALGIMQGVGGSSFAPGKALTRAQYCSAVYQRGSTPSGAEGKVHHPRLCGRQLRPG